MQVFDHFLGIAANDIKTVGMGRGAGLYNCVCERLCVGVGVWVRVCGCFGFIGPLFYICERTRD